MITDTGPHPSAFLVAALLLTGCGQGESARSAEQDPPVQTIPAVRLAVRQSAGVFRAAGVVRARERAEISTRMAGRIESVRVRPGDRVRAGQLLATLDGATVDASVDQVAAALELATTNLRRVERLYADSAVPVVQLEQARASHAQATAQAKAAANERRYTSLTAPFAGVVTARSADPGDLATPGRPLIVIEGDGAREIVLAVPEPVAARLKRGQTITTRIGSDERPVTAQVAAIVPAADPASRTIEVRLTTAHKLAPNLTAVADLPGGAEAPGLLVPRSAIVARGQLTGVFLFAPDSTVRLRWIRLGRHLGDQVEVLSGLIDGDLVVADAATGRDGIPARPALGGPS